MDFRFASENVLKHFIKDKKNTKGSTKLPLAILSYKQSQESSPHYNAQENTVTNARAQSREYLAGLGKANCTCSQVTGDGVWSLKPALKSSQAPIQIMTQTHELGLGLSYEPTLLKRWQFIPREQ